MSKWSAFSICPTIFYKMLYVAIDSYSPQFQCSKISHGFVLDLFQEGGLGKAGRVWKSNSGWGNPDIFFLNPEG